VGVTGILIVGEALGVGVGETPTELHAARNGRLRKATNKIGRTRSPPAPIFLGAALDE
jgi:hypothetical protein